MALSITNLKKGTIFQLEGHPYRVVEYSQKVMGRGGSIVNVKIKSLIDDKVLEKTFKGNESLESAHVEHTTAQFLYSDDKLAYFMDNKSFENHEIGLASVKDQLVFLKEGSIVQVQVFEGKAIGIELPKNVYLSVVYAENAVRGDTSSALTKEAELETGVKVRVPAFIKTGDIISVDTTTGFYRTRKKD